MSTERRSDHSDRSTIERVERLKQRLATVTRSSEATSNDNRLAGILAGVLDLLADRLS